MVLLLAAALAAGCRSKVPGQETADTAAAGTAASEEGMGTGAAGVGDRPSGSWWKVRRASASESEDPSEEEVRKLAALGYLGGYEAAPERSGVLHSLPDRAFAGYNLVASGHGPEAFLTDMQGKVVHRWRHEAPPDYGVPPERNFWRRTHLLEDGSLLAIFDPFGIVKLDRHSRLVWASDPSENLHHDLDVTADGRIFTLGKRSRKIPEIHDEVSVAEDMVVILDGENGQVLDRFSIFEAFQRSPYGREVATYVRQTARLAAEKEQWGIEDLHTNTIQVFDGSQVGLSPLFKKGNMIFCSPHLNNVFIIDGETRTVVWNWSGPWYRIHEPQLVAGGTFVLFHNNGYQEEDRFSQVLEYDLLDRREVWSYEGDPARPETRFFSGTSSTVSRLPNGNTLIVVTESGRVLEVTPAKEVVWEYINPARAGDEEELVAAVFQLDRLPPDQVTPWLSTARRSRPAA